MRVSATKTSPRVERNIYITSKQIKGYGYNNDYPQKILEIVNSSGTGKVCMDIYVKFVGGAGFTDQVFSDTIINSKNERVSSLQRKFAKDLKLYNGFACLVKYDGMGMPSEYYNVPFEHCRLEVIKYNYTGKIAIHPDWTNITGKPFVQDDVKIINRYNPSTVIVEMTLASGPENYPGQVYYFTTDGDFEYPICPFDPIVGDMLTEESVSTVKYRNAKFNFLQAGILVRKGIKPRTLPDGTIDPLNAYNQEQAASAEQIKKMQGDQNASKIWIVDVDADEEVPQFIDFSAKNYDRQYEVTEKTIQQNIGSMFMIPPVLRGIDVGAGFGSELVAQAYAFMNSVVGDDRAMIENVFKDLFQFYMTKFTDFTIKPLEYVSNVAVTPLP